MNRKTYAKHVLSLALGVFLGIVLFEQPLCAAPILINFDALAGMSNSPGSVVPLPSRLSNQYQATVGALFTSASPFVAVVNLTSSGPNHAITNPNGIGGVSASGSLSYGTPISVSFFEPVTGLLGVTDFVSIRGDKIAIAGTATMMAFGVDSSLLGSVTANDVSGGLTLMLSVPGIHRVVVSETSATIAFDNLQFNLPVVAPVAIPEPSSLLLLGTGAVSYFQRIRRRKGPTYVDRAQGPAIS